MAFFIKQNDTSPALQVTLKDASGTAIDLSGATVRFHMRQIGNTTAKGDAAAIVSDIDIVVIEYAW